MESTRTFSPEQYADALESWEFLDLHGMTPVFTSPFGDLFLRAEDGVWLLDLVDGSLTRVAESVEQARARVSGEAGQDDHLFVGLARAAEARGLVPQGDEVYGFVVPPVLGGATDVDNVEVIDFVVGVNLTGQVHAQTRDLPPGTPVVGVTLSDEPSVEATRKGWFRRR